MLVLVQLAQAQVLLNTVDLTAQARVRVALACKHSER